MCGETLDLDWCVKRFRLASRELFNQWFCEPDSTADYKYEFYDGFNYVENALFKMMVLEPCSVLLATDYELHIEAIRVLLPVPNQVEGLDGSNEPSFAPIMLNREINAGYWDFPVTEFTNEATLLFTGFFDFASMHSRDNHYVEVEVKEWPSHPETVGKRGLVEAHYVRYALHEVGNS